MRTLEAWRSKVSMLVSKRKFSNLAVKVILGSQVILSVPMAASKKSTWIKSLRTHSKNKVCFKMKTIKSSTFKMSIQCLGLKTESTAKRTPNSKKRLTNWRCKWRGTRRKSRAMKTTFQISRSRMMSRWSLFQEEISSMKKSKKSTISCKPPWNCSKIMRNQTQTK